MSGDDLRALAEAATPGPWRADVRDGDRLCGLDGPNYAEVLLPGRVDCMSYCYGGTSRIEGDNIEANAAFIAAANPTAVLALLDEVDRLRTDIAEAEQRGREDSANHGMCYVSGSKALEAILDERDALRAAVERVWALADEWVKRDCEWSCESEMLADLHVALDGPA